MTYAQAELMNKLEPHLIKERRIKMELATTKPGPHQRDLLRGLNKVQRTIAKIRKQAIR